MSAMIEDEAMKKWCPMVRHQGDGDKPSGNREGGTGIGTMMWNKCWGSQCMMWQWAGEGTGYCGLAGVPMGLGGAS